MPSLKVCIQSAEEATDDDLARLNDIVIDGLEAHGEHAEILVFNNVRMTLSGGYIELLCRWEQGRTLEKLKGLAQQLDDTAREMFDVERPIRVRIIMLEEPLLTGVN